MAQVFLGVGSNLGDRLANIEAAYQRLVEQRIRICACSAIRETEPAGGPAQGKYLNAVIGVETDLEPLALLEVLKNIERDLGRVKTVKDGPRPIDLDILLYDQLVFDSPALTIPHPRMFTRDFVMIPLWEIVKDEGVIKFIQCLDSQNRASTWNNGVTVRDACCSIHSQPA